MWGKRIRLFLVFALPACCLCCEKGIWEARGECPCIFTLDLGGIPKGIDTLHVWIFGENDTLLYRDTVGKERFGGICRLLIQRDMLRCYIWGNIRKATALRENRTLNSSLSKREDVSPDSLYGYSGLFNTRSEYAGGRVRMNKEFATVDVFLKGYKGSGNSMWLEISGNSSGFYIDGRCIPGAGRTIAFPHSPDTARAQFTYRLLRQASLTGLNMALLAMDNGLPEIQNELPVGKWLAGCGYDMQAPDLADIRLEIDLSVNMAVIRTEDWQAAFPADVKF